MMSKNNSDFMFENYHLIINLVSFSIFETIQKLNSRLMCIIYTFLLISALHLTKIESTTRKSLLHGLHYYMENRQVFGTQKIGTKMAISPNLKLVSAIVYQIFYFFTK